MKYWNILKWVKLFIGMTLMGNFHICSAQAKFPIVYLGADIPIMGKQYYGPMYYSDVKSREVWITEDINGQRPFISKPIEFPKFPQAEIQYFAGNFWAKKGIQIFLFDKINQKWQLKFNLSKPFMKFIPTTDGAVLITGSLEWDEKGQRHLGPILQKFDGVSSEVLIPRPGLSPSEDWALWSSGATDLFLFEMEDSVLIFSPFSGYLGVYDAGNHRLRNVDVPWRAFDLRDISTFLNDPKNRSTLKVMERDDQPGKREVIVAPGPRKIQFIPSDHFSVVIVYADEDKMPPLKKAEITDPLASGADGKRMADIRVPESSKVMSGFELNLISLEKTPINVDTDFPYPFWLDNNRLVPLGAITHPSKEVVAEKPKSRRNLESGKSTSKPDITIAKPPSQRPKS